VAKAAPKEDKKAAAASVPSAGETKAPTPSASPAPVGGSASLVAGMQGASLAEEDDGDEAYPVTLIQEGKEHLNVIFMGHVGKTTQSTLFFLIIL